MWHLITDTLNNNICWVSVLNLQCQQLQAAFKKKIFFFQCFQDKNRSHAVGGIRTAGFKKSIACFNPVISSDGQMSPLKEKHSGCKCGLTACTEEDVYKCQFNWPSPTRDFFYTRHICACQSFFFFFLHSSSPPLWFHLTKT